MAVPEIEQTQQPLHKGCSETFTPNYVNKTVCKYCNKELKPIEAFRFTIFKLDSLLTKIHT